MQTLILNFGWFAVPSPDGKTRLVGGGGGAGGLADFSRIRKGSEQKPRQRNSSVSSIKWIIIRFTVIS